MKADEAFTDGGVLYVAKASGACPANAWVQVGGNWYLTGSSCAARTGWVKSGGVWYYLDPSTSIMKANETFTVGEVLYVAKASGACPSSSWVKAAGHWYLTDSSCAVVKGWAKVGRVSYYLDPSTGIMKENESFEVDGVTYAADASGACLYDGWIEVDGGLVYTDGAGSVAKGWKMIDGIWYYFDTADGKMKANELFVAGGTTYIARPDGSCPVNSWVGLGGKWYRTNSSCAVRKGWMDTGVTWYYFDPADNGASATGTRTINGKTYFFHSPMGGLAAYEYVTIEDGTRAYVNGDGILGGEGPVADVPRSTSGWIRFDGDWYYIDAKTGEPTSGWVDYKGHKYWLDSEGVMVTGTHLIDGKAYSFSTSGALIKELNGTAEDLISVAKKDVGYNVVTDPERGSKYGRWYQENANPYKSSVDYGANGVAYCVMAISYWLDQANVGAPGFPRAGCEGAALHARKESRAVAPNEIEAGMLVLFDWDRDGEPDHIGIVEERISDRLFKTVEGNTTSGNYGSQDNGGWVASRTRDIDDVYCGVRPYYM